MDIDNVPGPVWVLLAKQARQADKKRSNVAKTVDDYFYNHVYRRWTIDFQPINYKSNLDGVKDVGWATLAKEWIKPGPAKIGPKDHSTGARANQVEDNDPTHAGTRLGESYSDKASVSRFQFLVESGGGMVLLNRMRRACQEYFAVENATVVKWWKVFGENFADKGQSDACVVYLLLPYDDPDVVDFIDNYLWPNVKDIINDKFVPCGLVRIGAKPLWATWIPSRDTWGKTFGKSTLETHYGSAGGLMGLVFGKAFSQAIAKAKGPIDEGSLIAAAKVQARAVISSLQT
jgi:hypothetical protein